jgi:hypothetical protein
MVKLSTLEVAGRGSTRSFCRNPELPKRSPNGERRWRKNKAKAYSTTQQCSQWRKAIAPPKIRPDALLRGEAAWKNFIGCVTALPGDQAMPLWQALYTEAAARIAG